MKTLNLNYKLIKFYILSLISILLITVSCKADDKDDIVQVPMPKNCNCIKYNITKTITPLPVQVTTEEIIEEPYCGEPTPYPILIGASNNSNMVTRVEAWYEVKCE